MGSVPTISYIGDESACRHQSGTVTGGQIINPLGLGAPLRHRASWRGQHMKEAAKEAALKQRGPVCLGGRAHNLSNGCTVIRL